MEKAGAFRRMDMTQFAIAYRRDVREKVCYHLRWGKIFRKLGLYACPAGASFCADKRMQKRFRAAP